MRGKANADREEQLRIRITPACAGKSCIDYDFELSLEDHPRVCGEKNFVNE